MEGELRRETHGRSMVRTIRYSKDPSLPTVLFEDSAALIGLVAAFVGIYLAEATGDSRFDGVGSLVIGVVLAVVAVVLAYESRGLLIGERAEPELGERIRAVVESDPGVTTLIELRTMLIGPRRVLVSLRAAFNGRSGTDIEKAVARLGERLGGGDGGRWGELGGGLHIGPMEPVAASRQGSGSGELRGSDEGQKRDQRPSR